MSNKAQDILETILEKLRSLASTETVIGEPVELGDVTLMPVIKMSIGFGAGGGEGTLVEDKSGKGSGGGGGGGAQVTPIGFLIWDGDEVRFISVGKGKVESLIETVPELMTKFGIKFKGGKKSKGESEGKEKSEE